MVTQASTREAYGKTLLELGRENTNIVVIGGDLNKSTMTTFFAKEFPDRFFDCGAAEQNMMSISAGLASSGKIPFVSTFAVFGSGRPFDQIRISIAQARANVKIVVTHAGIITGSDGMSAHGIEDLALMCSLVGFTVVVPADARETAQVIRSVAEMDGPCYIRLSRPATPLICPEGYRFQPGKASVFRPGGDVSILATGIMVAKALEAAGTLAQEGIDARVVNVSTLKPIDQECIIRCAHETGAIVTAEEHLKHGGLGSIVSQVLVENCPVPVSTVAIEDVYSHSGEADELLQLRGLTPEKIQVAVREVVARKG
ncbi:MAG: transketolase family protein [Chloroflexi bacterium]|nr:transketolase family protein [Chloroflexota bacterium]